MSEPNPIHGTVPRAEYARHLVGYAPLPGQQIAGKYRVERVLGEGGMGVVVAARHLHLDECVALKFLQPQHAGNSAFVDRFLREARMAVKIRSEHVGRIFDVGKLDDGTPYMVMEYLDGCDLAALLCAEGRLAIERVVQYILQACEALSEAHVHGIVHRDLKPENLFLTRRADGSPCVKVLDFGISKMVRPGEANHTATATVMGSPLYMSPEQLRSHPDIDARADIWSLGVVLFELITGEQPFLADSITQLCVKILEQPAPLLCSILPTAPPELEALIARCLEKDPALRFPGISELARALAPFGPSTALVSVERASLVASVEHDTSGRDSRTAAEAIDVEAGFLGSEATEFDSSTPLRIPTQPRLLLSAGVVLSVLAVLALLIWSAAREKDSGHSSASSPARAAHSAVRAPLSAGQEPRRDAPEISVAAASSPEPALDFPADLAPKGVIGLEREHTVRRLAPGGRRSTAPGAEPNALPDDR